MKWVLDPTKPHQRYFEEMTRIPHGSFHEEAYSDYLVEFAKNHGFDYIQDEMKNVVIYKPASKGMENRPAVAIQAHMDMVWVKDEGVEHNFLTDPLPIYIEDGFLTSRGTTLGADNGTGVAYMLAVLDDETAVHPPLQAVFTVEEETGLGGALALSKDAISAKRYISLDCGGGDEIYISSLAGYRTLLSKKLSMTETAEQGLELKISGLKGGYSGGYFEEQRNANKLMGEMLSLLSKTHQISIASIYGGETNNQLCKECIAIIACESELETIKADFHSIATKMQKEISPIEDGAIFDIQPIAITKKVSLEDSKAVINLLHLLPCGFKHRHSTFGEIMSDCSNIAMLRMEEDIFVITYALRGSSDFIIEKNEQETNMLCDLLGFEHEVENSFPAWEFHDSDLLKTLQKVFKEENGKEIGLIPIQGGLECGVFAQRYPDMDLIAMGPYGYDVHTTAERMDIANFDSLFVVFQKLLSEL